MENIKDRTADLVTHVEHIANTYKKLAKIEVTEKVANVTSITITTLILYTAGMLVLILGGIAFSWWLGDITGSRPGGFLLGAVFFAMLMIIAGILRKKTLLPFFRDLIIRKVYE